MTSLLAGLSPSITDMIRFDHSHVLSAYREYELSDSRRVRGGLVDNICLALEIHAELEEEIFYPALQAATALDILGQAALDHSQMRRQIAVLRSLNPDLPEYDQAFQDLMRGVLHHIADEETQLLPAAERQLAAQLSDLGARMTRRRLELTMARSGRLASSMLRSLSPGTAVAAAAVTLEGLRRMARDQRVPARWLQRRGGPG